MKKILLPTDFSTNSMNAIEYAMRFFEQHECEFYILNVQKASEYISDDLMAGGKSDTIYESITVDNKKQIIQLVRKLSKRFKSQPYSFHGLFDYDDFVAAVQQAVQFHQIDLIVMGSNGASNAVEQLFGSNTLQVIRNVSCPTMTIPDHFSFSTIEHTLFSTQHGEELSLEGIQGFKDLLALHPSDLHVLELDYNTFPKEQREDSERLQTVFPKQSYTYYYLHSTPGLIAVNIAAQLLKIDLHAIFVEKESLLERLLFGSENSRMLYRTAVPLLFLPR